MISAELGAGFPGRNYHVSRFTGRPQYSVYTPARVHVLIGLRAVLVPRAAPALCGCPPVYISGYLAPPASLIYITVPCKRPSARVFEAATAMFRHRILH